MFPFVLLTACFTVELVTVRSSFLLMVLFKRFEKWIAILIPILFILNVTAMFMLNLQGGEAAALIGGTSIFILILISLSAYKNQSLE
jgi:hypothetical protein